MLETKLAATQLKLASRARTLSRTIYSSLPFLYRFGKMLEILSDNYAKMREELGKILYAEFVKAGVPGMPHINGKPAETHTVRKRGAHAAHLLPKGYGAAFASRVLTVIRKFIKNEADVKDFVGKLNLMIAQGKLQVKGDDARDLGAAESFTRKFVEWRAKDFIRSRKKGPATTSLTDVEMGGQYDVVDEDDMEKILSRLSPGDEAKMMRELRRLDRTYPHRPEQFVLLYFIQGKNKQDIAEEWGIKPSTMAGWVKDYLPRIQKVFAKYFWVLEEAV